MNNVNFKITLTMATPFTINSPMTLDALLSAAIYRQQGLMGEDTIPHIPLARENGIFKGSSLHYKSVYQHQTTNRVMSLKNETDLSVNAFSPNRKRGDNYIPVDQKRGQYKANLDSYPAISSNEVYFWGVGDPDKVVFLLDNYIQGIGKRSNAGAGEIISVAYESADSDYSWVTESGTPARPLPIELWQQLSSLNASKAPMTVDIPYWGGKQVEAVFPIQLAVSL